MEFESEKTPTIEQMIQELERAGWVPRDGRKTRWVSPWGALFFGPYQAWTIMKAQC